jgi:hypothetical protein
MAVKMIFYSVHTLIKSACTFHAPIIHFHEVSFHCCTQCSNLIPIHMHAPNSLYVWITMLDVKRIPESCCITV